MSKSRHTPISGVLTRSFGIEDNMDLVAGLDQSGHILVRQEPVHRKLKRGEKLPEVRISVHEIWANRAKDTPVEKQKGVVESAIDKLVSRIPIANFGDMHPDKIAYQVKVWLMSNAKQILEEE